MKKEEKTRHTREKILQAAITEFGENNYDSVSLNSICKKYRISKGLVYHNFKSKDELYLVCVKECFEQLTAYLKSHEPGGNTIVEGVENLLGARRKFLNAHPDYRNIFFNVILYPALHLEKEIQAVTWEYKSYVQSFYRGLLSKIRLRKGITLETALEYFSVFQDIYNGYYQGMAYQKGGFTELIEEHEIKILKLLEIVLYGISGEELEG